MSCFFFNDTATTEIYTYLPLFPYTTLFRSDAGVGAFGLPLSLGRSHRGETEEVLISGRAVGRTEEVLGPYEVRVDREGVHLRDVPLARDQRHRRRRRRCAEGERPDHRDRPQEIGRAHV